MTQKERIHHRTPYTFGSDFGKKLPTEIYDTYYDQQFNKDYVAYDDDGEIIAVCKNKRRLRRFLRKQKG